MTVNEVTELSFRVLSLEHGAMMQICDVTKNPTFAFKFPFFTKMPINFNMPRPPIPRGLGLGL